MSKSLLRFEPSPRLRYVPDQEALRVLNDGQRWPGRPTTPPSGAHPLRGRLQPRCAIAEWLLGPQLAVARWIAFEVTQMTCGRGDRGPRLPGRAPIAARPGWQPRACRTLAASGS